MAQRFFIAAFSVMEPKNGPVPVINLLTGVELITAGSQEEADDIASRLAHERWSLNDGRRCFIHLREFSRQTLADWLNGINAGSGPTSEPDPNAKWVM